MSEQPQIVLPRQRREWSSQEAYYTFLCKALPHGAFCLGIDEAAKRSRQANMRRKARGCHGGVADLMVCWNGVVVWLECKEANGPQRSTQETFERGVKANGCHYALVRCMEDVEAVCLQAGIPLRATLGAIRTRIAEQNERLAPKRKRAASAKREPRFTASKGVVRRAAANGVRIP